MASADFHAGRKVGKYEILTLLSMGGMAELFLAYTAGPGGFRKFVALKQILPDIKKDESFVKMFLDEARITAAFSHSNIGQVFDLGEEEGELYLAMEFIAGQNLEYLIKVTRKAQQAIPVGFAAMAVRDTCLALHYAHHFVEPSGKPAPVVHRDVSPKNVMVTYDGNVKVIDFGIAKAKGRLNRTQAGMVKGTSGYMSPEQVRNEQLDGRSDLFSAAVMLWEFLCGQRLFEAPGEAATMVAIVENEIPDPRTINPAVPEALAKVVLKALSRPREQRYATGKEFARAIDAAMGAEIFDEDKAAAYMQEVFAEKVKKTRALLEMASRDDGELSKAAENLREDAEQGSGGKASKKQATPAPRASPSAGGKGLRDSQRITKTPGPRAQGGAGGVRMPEAPPRAVSRAEPNTDEVARPNDRFKSSVAKSYEMYDEAGEATELKPRAAPSASGGVSDPRTATPPTGVRPVVRRGDRDSGSKKKRWYSVGGFWLFLLVLFGGVTFATTKLDGPLGEFVKPRSLAAEAWIQNELAGEPPPPPPTQLKKTTKPAGIPPPEAAAFMGPDGQPLPAQPAKTEPPPTPDSTAANAQAATPPTTATDVEPAATKTHGAATSKKGSTSGSASTTPTAKDPGETGAASTSKTGGEKKGHGSATAKNGEDQAGEVEVLDTSNARAAEKSGMGWLTLYTVPQAFVYDGEEKLGGTPITRYPMMKGTYKLRVLDAESKFRILSAPIRPGQETKLTINVSDLPLDPNQD